RLVPQSEGLAESGGDSKPPYVAGGELPEAGEEPGAVLGGAAGRTGRLRKGPGPRARSSRRRSCDPAPRHEPAGRTG
ncbi:hypothetical protein ACLQ2A_36195, partial [Streptomyces prasinus]